MKFAAVELGNIDGTNVPMALAVAYLGNDAPWTNMGDIHLLRRKAT